MLPLRVSDEQDELTASQDAGPRHLSQARTDDVAPDDLKSGESEAFSGYDDLHRMLSKLARRSTLAVVGATRHALLAVCHARTPRVAGASLLLFGAACAPHSGWARIDQVCGGEQPPRVCLQADPDAPVTLDVGGTTLVPGECAQAPEAKRAGLSVVVRDGSTGASSRHRVRAGVGATAVVEVRTEPDALEITVSRRGC